MGKRYKAVRKSLDRAGFTRVEAAERRSSIVLTGKVDAWDDKIRAGYAAAGKGYKGVVNDIEVPGVPVDTMAVPELKDSILEGRHFDVVIIGGGITGTAIARELSRYDISIALFEKEEDVARHASGRNDGMIHDGFACKPGTKKALYNVRGNRLYSRVTKELGVEFTRPGSMILFSSPLMRLAVPIMKARARKNNVDGYCYLSRKKVAEMEPCFMKKQYGAFFLPSAGILSPYKMVIAYAENAVQNGAEVVLSTVVTGFDMNDGRIERIRTNRGTCTARLVINAAGIWADTIAGYADDRFFSLHGRKGTDAIMDLKTGQYQRHIAAMPDLTQKNSKTKGGGLVLTPEGNILVGPTAVEVSFREDYATDPKDIDELMHHIELNKKLSRSQIITYFAGIRACTYEEDFIVEASERVKNLVHAAGIQSPGLASAPAIAEDIVKISLGILGREGSVREKKDFNPLRKGIPNLKKMSLEERDLFIKRNPAYGRIVCRCEEISEGEIRDALRSPLPVSTLDGLKRRVRVSAGRCHGGFCTPRVLEIMAEEWGQDIIAMTKKGAGSPFFFGHTKEEHEYRGRTVKTMNAGGAA